jgi:hypothetical protein
MAFARRDRPDGTPAESLLRCEKDAYILLEETRLRCERMLQTAGDQQPLRALHRELGLAGFLASSNLPSDKRREALARARDRVCAGAAEAGDIGALPALVDRARLALESGLIAPEFTEHVHLAHVHALRARDLLTKLLSGAQHASLSRAAVPPQGFQPR